jgi:hypothetical protein
VMIPADPHPFSKPISASSRNEFRTSARDVSAMEMLLLPGEYPEAISIPQSIHPHHKLHHPAPGNAKPLKAPRNPVARRQNVEFRPFPVETSLPPARTALRQGLLPQNMRLFADNPMIMRTNRGYKNSTRLRLLHRVLPCVVRAHCRRGGGKPGN